MTRRFAFVVLAVVALAISAGANAAALRVFIRASEKTHGPGEHDYPQFLADWKKLLADRGAKADGALRFPTPAELAKTDVLILHASDGGNVGPADRTSLEAFLQRGGGMVVLHDGLCGTNAAWFASVAGGAKQHGVTNWQRGTVGLYFNREGHPITDGIENFDLDDEMFHHLLFAPDAKILDAMEPDERRNNYAADITYGTSKEMGFDFLRDRLRKGAMADEGGTQVRRYIRTLQGAEEPVQRSHYFALIDEADSILIDEARTPLIIGLTQPNEPATVNLFRWSNRATFQLEPRRDYVYEPERRTAWLTDAGCRKVVLMSKPSLLSSIDTERIYTQVEKALTARHAFELDRDYVIVENKVVIVDEGTGRIMDGRKWQDGLHQAIEAKELIPITAATGEAARITVQSYFRQYSHLAGMTGTALPARGELKKTYRLKVTKIPTNKKCIRRGLTTRIFKTQEAKRDAIVEQIQKLIKAGRSILIGTPSVEASEALGQLLGDKRIPYQILNARYHETEAEIVSKAGQVGAVTIATNMAGRGTDIILDDDVRRAGGLHVIATEMHSSKRIDRQLVGRCARQGDPGSYQFFLSLEDELLRCREPKERLRKQRMGIANRYGELGRTWIRYFAKVQRFLEKTHRKQRKHLLKQERMRLDQYENMGLDPYLELTES